MTLTFFQSLICTLIRYLLARIRVSRYYAIVFDFCKDDFVFLHEHLCFLAQLQLSIVFFEVNVR